MTAEADSPRASGLAPGVDIRRVSSTLDPAAGTWTLRVTYAAAPKATDIAALNAYLFPARAGCAQSTTDALAWMRGAHKPATADVMASILPAAGGLRGAQSASKPASGDPATVEFALTDTALVGRTPGCVSVSVTHHRTLDSVTARFSTAPDEPAPPADPAPAAPGPTPAPTPAPPRFTHADARLTLSRSGTVTVALEPFTQAVGGTLIVRANGRTIGRTAYRAAAGRHVKIRVKLSAGTRRTLARRIRVRVTLTATAKPRSGETLTRRTHAVVLPHR